MNMKSNILFAVILMCVLSGGLVSCSKGETDIPIFRKDPLQNISLDLDFYRNSNDFTVTLTGHEEGQYLPRFFPGYWYYVENDDIRFAFWPQGHARNATSEYSLQYAEFKQKSKKYHLSRYIGMTGDKLRSKYPNPDIDFERDFELSGAENQIGYYSVDGKRMIRFFLHNNVIKEAGFAYRFE